MKKTQIQKNTTRYAKRISALSIASCMLLGMGINANATEEKPSSKTLALGTPNAFLHKMGLDDSTSHQLLQHSLSTLDHTSTLPRHFNFLDNQGQEIRVLSTSTAIEKNGYISISGEVADFPNSKFILQGDSNHLYGWVILKEQDLAYEYITENGQLIVKEINEEDVHPVCDIKEHAHSHQFTQSQTVLEPQLAIPKASSIAPHIGNYSGEHVGKLQSRPGSSYVIFIDTKNVMSDGEPFDVSKEFIWTTWQIVAASFSMFDVNVTTDQSVYNQATPSRRGGGTMYRQDGRSSCHFAFGTSTFCTLYKENDASGQGRTAAHEFGHLLHLGHDGGAPGGEYHEGLADFQWVPIMGNYWFGSSWPHALYQWSKGEYSGASNREDDFAKMQRFIPFKQDDNSSSKALVVSSNGSVSAQQNTGQIERNTDSDNFTFSVGGSSGQVNLTIDRIEHIGGAMLDVQALIKNSSGAVVAQSNKRVNRSASFNQSLPAGDYTLVIEGGAEGTPQNGFSKYSSMGYYAISGSITGSTGGGNTPPVADFSTQKNNLSVSFNNLSTDDKGVVSYSWNFGDTNTSNQKNPTYTYSSEGAYTVSLTVRDEEGETARVDKTVTVTSGSSNQAPVADFSFSKNNLSVSFTDSSSDDKDVTRYQWQFGDGNSSSTKNPTHSYSAPGTYTVSLTVYDEEGVTGSETKSVQVTAGGDCSVASWDNSKVYVNGDRVSQAGNIYQAKWWTRGQSPSDFSGQWAVWQRVGSCK